MSLIDSAMELELVYEWLPDFIAWAENPFHIDGQALFEQAAARVRKSFHECYDDAEGVEPGEVLVAAETAVSILTGCAEYIVQERTGSDND
jgi:hypothetical protein